MSNFKIVKLVDPIQLNLAGGLNFQGDYDNATAYVVGDVVTYNGSSYAALQNTTGNLPTDVTYWQVLANKGDTGATGATGAGVASGGTTNQALTKIDGTDYNTQWSTVDKSFVGLGNVDNTSDANKPVSTATQTALDGKVDENVAITGATKTKITYDAKGLVTAGADATTADIADSTNKRYVTDANLTVIGNTSGTNTGDNATNSQYSGLDAAKVNKAGDTMTGNLNMGTNKLIGGTRITDVLKLQGTTDNGTLTGPAIQLLTGNNGATTALTVLNNGNVGIGTTTPGAKLQVDTGAAATVGQIIKGASAQTADLLQIQDSAANKLMVVSSGGNVGIGTTSPANRLSVVGSITATGNVSVDSNIYLAGSSNKLININSATNWQYSIASSNNDLRIYDSNNTDFIKLFYNGGGVNKYASILGNLNVINNGNVGIGTTSPSNTLEVNKAVGTISATQLAVTNSQAGGYGAGIGFYAKQTDNGLLYEQAKITADGEQSWGTTATRSSGLRFFTVNAGTLSEKLRISTAGNVGIGTTSPAEKFVVSDTTSISLRVQSGLQNNIRFMRTAAAAGTSVIGYSSGGASGLFNGLVFSSYDGSVWRNNMYIADTGNVGIGTTTPSNILEVNKGVSTVSATQLTVANSNVGGWGAGISFTGKQTDDGLMYEQAKITADGDANWSNAAARSSSLRLFTTNAGTLSEKMRVSAAGNVGIGTTTPDKKLTVSSAGTGSEEVLIKAVTTGSTGYPVIQVDRNSTVRSATMRFSTAGTDNWVIGSPYNSGTDTDQFIIGPNHSLASAKMVIQSAGNVGIGTTTPSSTLDLHGSFELNIVNKTANYTAASETIINCTANTFTVTLPTAVGIDGRYYTIKNSGTGVITVATTSSQTIDGAATKSLPTQYDKVTVVSDGANWIIIG